MTTYAIGDLQGCCEPMQSLLEKIQAATIDPELVFLGDLVNRGPCSLKTLKSLIALGPHATSVLGNHDLHLLAVAHGIRASHVTDSFDEILAAPDRDDLLDWLRHRPLAIWKDHHLMIHGGVLPQWTQEQVLDLANEVETVLRGPDWVDFLREMYGNTPAQWDDGLRGVDRLRCIVNALTRLRFCSADGVMNFKIKENASAAPPGFMPWFDVPGRKTENVTIVFGHWSTLGLMIRTNLMSLDTGCVWGGKLTALRLSDRALFQVECPSLDALSSHT